MKTKWTEDIPTRPRADTIYIVGSPTDCAYAVLKCPQCDEKLTLNLIVGTPARWDLTESNGEVSLTPSVIHNPHGCGAHFWVRGGEIVLC